MFDGIADRYDRINDLMTLSRHRAWKRDLVAVVGARPGDAALDLCTGTGDIAALLAEAVHPGGSVTGLDFSPEMLRIARMRHPGRIDWQAGDALALSVGEAAYDVVTIGFGLRNIVNLDRALAEVFRVLRPGGRFASLDLSKPADPVVAAGVRFYSTVVAGTLARLAGAEPEPYRYLPRSNRTFPDSRSLAARLASAGFEAVEHSDRGLGAVALVWGRKPS
jgi:demethylmenaquinone methyltransferase/2-methoxy-6-polyprenyl-1,4-benzoquinol methylase